jgi:aspartate/methionine/tyrosine aminotransferase
MLPGMTRTHRHRVSTRGAALADAPPMPAYLMAHFAHADDERYVPLCVAENRLVYDLLAPKVNAPRDVPPEALGYADMVGPEPFRDDLAAFLSRWVLGRPVRAEQLAVLAGAGSILETLFYALADPGEGVLVPTPSYAGFWMDLEGRDALRIVPVHTRSEDDFRLTPALLDAAVDAADVPVRALLFTTPNNPLGTVYTAAELDEILAWAEGRGVHVVFDEVYALSVFGDRPFTSAATLRPALGDHVHLVWALSKDFAASGLRCGVLISDNEAVLAAVNALAYWSACSGDTLHLVRSWLTDEDWLQTYVDGMRSRLGAAHARVTAHLDRHQIPHTAGGAGFFVLVDLRAFLDAPTFEAEDRLWRRLLDEAHVNLTPGSALRSVEPGLFRLCFTSVPDDVLQRGLDALTAALPPRTAA